MFSNSLLCIIYLMIELYEDGLRETVVESEHSDNMVEFVKEYFEQESNIIQILFTKSTKINYKG